MRACGFLLLFLIVFPALRAGEPWATVSVPPMKTSIYLGSVTLSTSPFLRDGERFTATYEARVRPWFFWSESGGIEMTVTAAQLARLDRGERIEFTGEARDRRQRLRRVTGYAERIDAGQGRLKIRIDVDGIELIFNGTYRPAPSR